MLTGSCVSAACQCLITPSLRGTKAVKGRLWIKMMDEIKADKWCDGCHPNHTVDLPCHYVAMCVINMNESVCVHKSDQV